MAGRRLWTEEETDALVNGVAKYVKNDPEFKSLLKRRSNENVKDKYRQISALHRRVKPPPKLEFAVPKPLPPPPLLPPLPPLPPPQPLPKRVHEDEGWIKLTLLASEEGDEEIVSVSVLDTEPCSVLLATCRAEFASLQRSKEVVELRVGQRVLDLNAPLRQQVQMFDLILVRTQSQTATCTANEND
ncbi:hypothetical protein BASA81_003502 [Batrachochytrium salamandrivorans]|nr:hypothetical protein BASA81_003502 [Batrachochytrium salamandrivorans]